MFARKHYEAIALLLKTIKPGDGCPLNEAMAQHNITLAAFADRFARDNPRFDRGRWHLQ